MLLPKAPVCDSRDPVSCKSAKHQAGLALVTLALSMPSELLDLKVCRARWLVFEGIKGRLRPAVILQLGAAVLASLSLERCAYV